MIQFDDHIFQWGWLKPPTSDGIFQKGTPSFQLPNISWKVQGCLGKLPEKSVTSLDTWERCVGFDVSLFKKRNT